MSELERRVLQLEEAVALVHCAESLKRYQTEIDTLKAERDRLRAALEEVAALIDRDDMADTAIDDAIFILRRALGPDRAA